MTTLISIIVFLVILGLIWWLVKMLPLPAPLGRAVDVLFVIIAILMLLGALTGSVPLPRLF